MESTAWKDANIYEKLFLTFCLAFDFVSGEMTNSEPTPDMDDDDTSNESERRHNKEME